MRKRGFTLVEMLAVVVILGLLLVVAIPQIQNQLLSKKDAVNAATLSLIYEAADSYISADPSTFQKMYVSDSERSSYCVRLQDLVDAGKLEAPLKDFSTGNEINLNFLIKATTNSYNEFEYSFVEDTKCGSDSQTMILYEDETLGSGTYPILEDGMIPVVYKNGAWVKASLYDEWYNYGSKHWANVVTVNKDSSTCVTDCIDNIKKHTRSGYEMAIAGTKISMDDINGMYVWIPRYEYHIVKATSAMTIAVNFIDRTDNTASSGSVIHPAFTFGDSQLGGIWVAKFEASPKKNSLCANDSDECNKSTIRIETTPNRNSLRNISLMNAFTLSKNMASYKEEYGLDSEKVDTHLMKNTEWGAVTYLTQSIYGLNKEVSGNRYYNETVVLTGCTSATVTTTCTPYNAKTSYEGTTTGNIYGIYDMSGGAAEFVMGNYNRNSGNSGVPLKDIYVDKVNENNVTEKVLQTSKIEDKYVNIYPTYTNASVLIGSAMRPELTNGTTNWYSDQYVASATATTPWLVRGGYSEYATTASLGLYAVNSSDGAATNYIGFRPVIVEK